MSYYGPSACPKCKEPVYYEALGGSDVRPKVGDLTVCGSCQAYLWFDRADELRPLTRLEYLALPEENRRELVRLQVAVAFAHALAARGVDLEAVLAKTKRKPEHDA